ncbi:hypothetical protein [Cetobacterium sp.]
MCSIKTTKAIGAIANIPVKEKFGSVNKSLSPSPENPIQLAL